MFCSKCGNKLSPNSRFCPNCGNAINNQNYNMGYNPNYNMTYNQNNNISKKSNGGKIAIIVGLSLIFLVLVIIALIPNSSTGTLLSYKPNKRTIMMYVVGSNLESDAKIVTAELDSINPSQIVLDNTNVLIYTGGTKKWHNFIKNDENAIYILTKNGFQKLATYPKKNMGDANTLTEFLNYAYSNYPAQKFNLIMYDHGGAIDGAIYDDYSGDNLSLEDFKTAMKNSKFNEKEKLQTVLFRTCLNGTLEVANIFKDYAEYMIASEEISYGASYSNVLSFINNVTLNDDGAEFGKKFVLQYQKQMSEIDIWGNANRTYSIIDLSKIKKVSDEVNNFFKNINLKDSYKSISRIRANEYQYGSNVVDFDTIDLYHFVSSISAENHTNANNLLNAISDSIIYNDSNMKNSHGLSIYFPYRGSEAVKYKLLKVYSKLTNFGEYYTFIKSFANVQAGNQSFNLNIFDNEIKISDNNEISIQLTEEQKENFAKASYRIFMQDKEHPNYYQIVYYSDDATVDSNGLLKANVENKLVKIADDNGDLMYMSVRKNHIDNRENIYTVAILEDPIDNAQSFFDSMTTANIYMEEVGNEYKFSTATIISDNERVNGTFIKVEDFKTVAILRSRYKIFDNNGVFIEDSDDWGRTPVIEGFDIDLDKIKLSKVNLSDDETYYCVFYVTDINNNSYYSNVVKVK